VIKRIGFVTIRHYDLCAQALSKLERGYVRDVADVRAMLERGLVSAGDLRRMFAAIEPQLYLGSSGFRVGDSGVKRGCAGEGEGCTSES